MTLPASVARFLINAHSSADHILTLQSNPAVTKNKPDLGNSPAFETGTVSLSMETSPFGSTFCTGVASGGASSAGAWGTAGKGWVGRVTFNGIWGNSIFERKNLRSDTEDLCAGIIYCVFNARKSHIRTVSSPDPVAIWYLKRSA